MADKETGSVEQALEIDLDGWNAPVVSFQPAALISKVTKPLKRRQCNGLTEPFPTVFGNACYLLR